MSSLARDRLKAAQASLADALLADGPVPHGFDAERVKLVAHTLSHKRSRSAGQAWPTLVKLLGSAYDARFAELVGAEPLAESYGPLLDGMRLAEALEISGELDAISAATLLDVRLRFKRTPRGLEPRRGPAFAIASTRDGKVAGLSLTPKWSYRRWLTSPSR